MSVALRPVFPGVHRGGLFLKAAETEVLLRKGAGSWLYIECVKTIAGVISHHTRFHLSVKL